ncbi:RNA polymerase sigma factor [Lentzea sp. NBRC 105346]|uniref:SigB/SigF/SigG family RNA polymerase sigma factor n=1 Tax=Lentzea sp. NBRC 105346 TaxID=3032205 RepID=UPI0024A4E8F7|nr:SigB/SigF/SigG family RNA polymerase sigma factor [Lentzea sp. NBRC 105346]GLZ34611.1 RNA polymerase sigma factor [Lentzea sp. NBRC 105346]
MTPDQQRAFERLARTPDSSPCRQELRERLVREYLPLARHIARRFAERGEPLEDLTQVAVVGLLNAIDRYDVGRQTDFLSFAVPTITGEVRRHFRDQCWAIRVPRRLKELCDAIDGATVELTHRTGRSPTPTEIARHLSIPLREVYEGLRVERNTRPAPLDLLEDNEVEDPALEGVEIHEALQPMLRGLPRRERTIVMLRFFGHMTQTEIARRVGISQMHVSRLITKSLEQLRRDLFADE